MSTPAPRRPGRRSIISEEIIDRIVTAVRGGNYLDDSARYAGIGERTIFEWLAKGREALEAAGDDIDLVPPDRQLYARLTQAVEKARSDAVVRNLTLIQRAAETNWQAAAWYLERTNPRKWGRRDTVEITGENGGAVRVEHSTARETLAAKFEAAERAARDVIEARIVEPDTPTLRKAQ